MSQQTRITKIALVGLGPKGLYGLERLLANLAEEQVPFPVEIHLFNKSDSFGAGDIYNPNQPHYLLMNYVNGYINMWTEQRPTSIVPQSRSFVQWLEDHQNEYPESNAYTFSSRATVGRYLSEGFEELLQACPDGVTIIKHVGTVIDLKKQDDGYQLIYHELETKQNKAINGFQHILIASGHPCKNDPATPSMENHIDFIYPVEQRLQGIPAGSKVTIKGLGLTFIDAVLALTEGRNGRFELNPDGVLIYKRSGNEPDKIYPFSNSGLLMIPRGNTLGNLAYHPIYLSEKFLNQLDPLDGKYDFERDLLPFIEQEFTAVYYDRKFKELGFNLSVSEDFSQVLVQIEHFHEQFPDQQRFDFHTFLAEPLADENLHENTLTALRESIQEAEIGTEKSAFSATADLWRHLSEIFNEVYKFGGLKPQSQKTFLQKYAGHLNRISYGPPIENMKKIEALAEAGLIDFSFSKHPFIPKGEKISLSNGSNDEITVDYLIDARIPKIQLSHCADEFYENLLGRELIIPYVNRQIGRLDFKPGCLAIDKKGHPIDKLGEANTSLTFIGTPTEGLTYDNDTLSRKRNDFVSDWAKELVENLLIQSPSFHIHSL